MKLMMPFTPHLSNECLENLDCKDTDKWPEIKKDEVEVIKFAIQVNGKTRDIITVTKGLNEDQINEIAINKSKANKFIENKKIVKIIFVKDKIINYIVN